MSAKPPISLSRQLASHKRWCSSYLKCCDDEINAGITTDNLSYIEGQFEKSGQKFEQYKELSSDMEILYDDSTEASTFMATVDTYVNEISQKHSVSRKKIGDFKRNITPPTSPARGPSVPEVLPFPKQHFQNCNRRNFQEILQNSLNSCKRLRLI